MLTSRISKCGKKKKAPLQITRGLSLIFLSHAVQNISTCTRSASHSYPSGLCAFRRVMGIAALACILLRRAVLEQHVPTSLERVLSGVIVPKTLPLS